VKAAAIIGAAVALGAGLPAAYVALGGGSYDAPTVADPCVTREWRDPDGLERLAEQIVLSSLDGAACDLGVSRETLTLALASEGSRARFARERGIDDARLEQAVREGLVRAVDDAEAAGALAGWQASVLRAAASRAPVDRILDVVGLVT
jgi:hypothetical protein